ncbi:MAG: LysE family translocator [Alphaproteobacteria bacterium]
MDPLALIPPLIFFALNVLTPGPNVLNTISISLGSGRMAGYGCALACAFGVTLWATVALIGASALFIAIPEARVGLTLVGATVLLYFAFRYIRRALRPAADVDRIEGATPRQAFMQALVVLSTNPKAMTTWIALLAIFPVISRDWMSMVAFAAGTSAVAGIGHFVYATVFSTRPAIALYRRATRPVNAAVGIGFTIYAVKLILGELG